MKTKLFCKKCGKMHVENAQDLFDVRIKPLNSKQRSVNFQLCLDCSLRLLTVNNDSSTPYKMVDDTNQSF